MEGKDTSSLNSIKIHTYNLFQRTLNSCYAHTLLRKVWFIYKMILEFTMFYPKLRCLCCLSGEYLKIKRVYYIRKKKMWENKAMTAVVPDIPDTWESCPIAGTHWRKTFPEPAILHYSFAFAFQSIFKFQESLPVYTDTTCSLNVCLWIVKCILSSALKQIVQKVAAALCWSVWSSAGTKKPSWGSR